jgi:4-amino-4-deoxy-L-arabinose transferase-like glycosyltransferase
LQGRQPLDPVDVLLWSWVAAILGFFTLSTFKLDHYVFPAAPALCLLCARAWAGLRIGRADELKAGTRIGLQLIGPLLILIGVGTGIFLVARLDLPYAAVAVPAFVTAAGIGMTARTTVGRTFTPGMSAMVIVSMIVTYGGIVGFVMPALERQKVVPDVARWVAAHAESERVATFGLNRWEPAFRFYVGRHTTFLDDSDTAAAFFSAPEPFFCAMDRTAFDGFVARGLPLKVVYEREGLWATTGRVLWRRGVPPVHFVIVTRAS